MCVCLVVSCCCVCARACVFVCVRSLLCVVVESARAGARRLVCVFVCEFVFGFGCVRVWLRGLCVSVFVFVCSRVR